MSVNTEKLKFFISEKFVRICAEISGMGNTLNPHGSQNKGFSGLLTFWSYAKKSAFLQRRFYL